MLTCLIDVHWRWQFGFVSLIGFNFQAEQPIKICDERNVVQYVNRAYEITTGCARANVLGSDASELHSRTVNSGSLHASVQASSPADLNMEGNHASGSAPSATPGFNPNRRRSSEWHCITVPGSSKYVSSPLSDLINPSSALNLFT